MAYDPFAVRVMDPDDVQLALDWAAREGWSPGAQDAACFRIADPDGFLIGEHDGNAAAVISVVNYDAAFSFLGLYIARPQLRGLGYGWRTWQAGIEHAGTRTIGLDGVLAQQANYRKSGFAFAYRNLRYGGVAQPASPPAPEIVTLADVPFSALSSDDATVFPASREAFLQLWISAPGHIAKALVRDGRLSGWAVMRPTLDAWKIGPLVADDRAGAEALLDALLADIGGAPVFLDVPEPNAEAVRLAQARGLTPVFETARMYNGPVRPVALHRVFGITSFELG